MLLTPRASRAPSLFWAIPNQPNTIHPDILAEKLQGSGAGIALHDDSSTPRHGTTSTVPRLHLRKSTQDGLIAIRPDGTRRPVLPDSLPSSLTALPARSGYAVMLDIVMGKSTEAAWESMETLIEQGLPAKIAASALIGTASDIARRVEDYRALGVTEIILTAPQDRAPYDAVRRDLMPLLRLTGDRASRLGSLEPCYPLADLVPCGQPWHGAPL